MNKKLIAVLCIVLTLVPCVLLTACQKEEESVAPTEEYKYYDTFEEVSGVTGFDIQLPEELHVESRAVNTDYVLQVIFDGGYIRKARSNQSIGNEQEYEKTETKTVDGIDVTFNYNGDKVVEADWLKGGYSLCIGFLEGTDEETVIKYISEIE